mgnify:CR=1 FL=1
MGLEEVAFLTREWRVAVDACVEVSREDVLDHPCNFYMLWAGLRQLNPIVEEIVSDPVNNCVGALSTRFN